MTVEYVRLPVCGRPCLLINRPNVVSVHSLNSAHRQICYSLRMDWAPAGAAAYRWRDDRAEAFAGAHHATLAVGRSVALPGQPTLRIAVIAAGVRWPDGSLRPAIEDQWGAGGLIDLLCEAEWQGVAPEAHAAAAAYRAIAHDIPTALGQCASGRELIEIGFADDVRTAAQLDCSGVVPLLRDGALIPA